jgi:hypothetical protein
VGAVIMGYSRRAFYKVVGQWKKRGQEEGGNNGGTSMALVTGGGNGEGKAMGCGHFRRGERTERAVEPSC